MFKTKVFKHFLTGLALFGAMFFCAMIAPGTAFADGKVIRVNKGQWEAIGEEGRARIIAVLKKNRTLTPGDTIVGDASVEPATAASLTQPQDYSPRNPACWSSYKTALAACMGMPLVNLKLVCVAAVTWVYLDCVENS